MDYTQLTFDHRRLMLDQIGVSSVDDLFGSMPARFRLDRDLELPPAASELQLQQLLHQRLSATRSADRNLCFMGGGAYDHFIPAIVDDVSRRGEFVTAYTPYQAEASQGALQAFFEFQTQVTRLTGLDVANASLYEAASAVGEAIYMAANATGKRRVLIASTIHPHYLQAARTAASDLPIELIELPATRGCITADTVKQHLDHDTACVVVQSPNVFGLIEPSTELFAAAHAQADTLAVSIFNPIAAAFLANPGQQGADIALGEGQPLGIPLQFGGPYLGLFAARQALMRKMPGRLIGQSADSQGRRGFCLTLQTREQHIRGAKATSNVCTNQGLLALRATVYLSAMGPQGLKQVAEQCYHKAHYAADQIARLPGFTLLHGKAPFFHEFVVKTPIPAAKIIDAARPSAILPGVPMTALGFADPNQLLVAVTEKRTRQDIDSLVACLKESAK